MPPRPSPKRKGRPSARAAPPRRAGGPAKRGTKPAPKRADDRGRPARRDQAAERAPSPRGAKRSGAGTSRTGHGQSGEARRRSAPRGLGGEQVEGRHAVRELLLAGTRKVRELWLSTEQEPAPILKDIVELARELRVPTREVSRGRLDAAARTDAPQGVLAQAMPLPESELDDLARAGRNGKPPFLLCCDGITDPGNLGALLRSAECAGVSGVVLPRHRAVHITPSVTKAAAGAIEHLPTALASGLPTALRRLSDLGVTVVGLDEAAGRTLWDLDAGEGPVALVLGAEGSGLGRLVRQRCDTVVSIPMRGRLSSLNVATAGALACFEIARRRV